MAATAEPRQEQAIDSGVVEAEIRRYTSELTDQTAVQPAESHAALLFWKTCHSTYRRLAPLAEDFISAPASQAYVERIFSLCGDLSARKRNRARKSLLQRVFLKMNSEFITNNPELRLKATRSTADAVERPSPVNFLRAAVMGINENA